MKKPFPYQQEAISKGVEYFSKNARGKMIMPCGSGKTLTGLWLAQELEAKSLIIAFPNLHLEAQTVETWLSDFKELRNHFKILVLGSDKKLGKLFEVEVTTNEDDIIGFLKKNQKKNIVVFTTYHSSRGIVNASKKTKFTFDLAIFDEAHHTAGVDKALFQLLLNNNDIKVRKRLFMTATPKVLAGLGDNQFVKSMDDERVYGSEFYNLTIREAISAGIISDYKVMTLYCSNEQVRSMYYENIVFKDSSNYFDEEHLRIVSIAVSVCKAIKKNNLKKVISYHSSVNKAKHFELVIAQVASKMGIKLKTFHLNSTDNALTREKVVRKYSKAGIALITNARLLNEGFDIPAVDAVCFADERHSATDIVQAAGRAWRVSPGKEFGYILIPCLVGDTVDLDHDNVKNLRRTLSVLAGQDEQLAAYFRQRQRGRAENMPNHGEMVIHDNSSISLNFEELLDDINVKVWTNIRSLYYRSYTDAQQWVQENLVPNGIDTIIKWRDYVEGLYPELPPLPGDIPKQPAVPYKSQGWSGFPDFLGTKKWDYQTAKSWVQDNLVPLGIDRQSKWAEYRAGKFPDIPELPKMIFSHPPSYKEFRGWDDWFGREKAFYWDYETSKKWVQNNLVPAGVTTFNKWFDYLNGLYENAPKMPKGLPKSPDKIKGFKSWPDFFGRETIQKWDFETAKSWVKQNLVPIGINNSHRFQNYIRGKYPDAPSFPGELYKLPDRSFREWQGWDDWFGL